MRSTFALAALLLALPAPASAQARTLDVPAGAAWTHGGTGMVLPAGAAGLARDEVRDNDGGGLDVHAGYADREDGTTALVSISRTMAPDVAIWFDRALAQLAPPAGRAAPAVSGFTRPGATAASGLRAALADDAPGMGSIAIAIAPLGQWMVKVRLGSTRLGPAALAERLDAFVAALTWPAETGTARAATPIEPCATPLRLPATRVRRGRPHDVAVDWVVWSDPPDRRAGPPRVYCREPGATIERSVYRRDGATDSYLIALDDAGIALAVGEETDLARLMGQRGRGRRYSVTLAGRESVSGHASFERLPPPDQALAAFRDAQRR